MPKINFKTGAVKAETKPTHPWSQLQENIYKVVETTQDNICIVARAGSGKTTTLVECMRRLPPVKGKVLFAAFNTRIVDELREKVPYEVECKTLHAIGLHYIKRNSSKFVKVYNYKTGILFKEMVDLNDVTQREFYFSERENFTNVISSIKKALLREEEVTDNLLKCLYEEETIFTEFTRYHLQILRQLVKKCLVPIDNERSIGIDFDDMLYLPLMQDWITPDYGCVFIDEAQDLTPVQHKMLAKLLRDDGRIIVAGDPQQSIYGFAGALTNSMLKLSSNYFCTELPLSISYRCKPAIIREANIFVSDIESADYLKGGTVNVISQKDLCRHVEVGDMVLSRTNAPLVASCLQCLAQGKPAIVEGANVYSHIRTFVKRMLKTTQVITTDYVNTYTNLCINMAEDKWKKQRIEDLRDIILIIMKSDLYTCPQDLLDIVDTVFTDKRGCITFSTIHKAKGLEANRVFILEPGNIPIKYAETPEALQQEYNLAYVAITRAKEELFYVAEKSWSWREINKLERVQNETTK